MLKSITKQNSDLKEQRNIFETIYLKWNRILSDKQLTMIKNVSKGDNYSLADAVDYSVSSSMLSGSSESLTDSVLSTHLSKNKIKKKIIGLFRRAAISIMFINRLSFLNYQIKFNRFSLMDSNNNNFQFILFDDSNSDKLSFSQTISTKNKLNDENKLKTLLNWFTLSNENNMLNQLNQISNDLNRYLFNEELCNFYSIVKHLLLN